MFFLQIKYIKIIVILSKGRISVRETLAFFKGKLSGKPLLKGRVDKGEP